MADKKKERDQYFEERSGTDKAHFHAVPHEDKGWAVKKEGEDKPVFTTDSKSKAADEANHLAKEAGTIAIIHSEHGKIEEQNNYEK